MPYHHIFGVSIKSVRRHKQRRKLVQKAFWARGVIRKCEAVFSGLGNKNRFLFLVLHIL